MERRAARLVSVGTEASFRDAARALRPITSIMEAISLMRGLG